MITTDTAKGRALLEQRVQAFHGVGLDQVLELIAYLRDGEDSVLVGGSLAYGLGNEKSDLDIVIAGPATTESSSRMPLEHFLESLRVDVWKLRQDEIDQLFQRAQEGLASQASFEGAFGDVFEQADLKLLHRVAYGVVVDGAPLVPTATRNYRDIARDVVVREYAERMRQSLYVAQLAVVHDNLTAAAMNARFGVEDALQAAIAARGLPFSDNKWLRVRLDQDVPDLQEIYRPFAILPDGESATSEFVAAAVVAATGLTGVELTVDALASHAAWENTDLRLMSAGDLRLLLTPKQGVVFELDDIDASAWETLGEEPRWACADRNDAQTRICFTLYAHGLVKLVWSRGLPLSELTVGEEGSA